jgi:hypothetical protein
MDHDDRDDYHDDEEDEDFETADIYPEVRVLCLPNILQGFR